MKSSISARISSSRMALAACEVHPYSSLCSRAWTPRRDFAVSKSVTQSLTVGSAAFQKAGAHRVTLRADPVRAHHGPTGGPARVASGREPRSPLGAGAASIGQFIHQPTERRARGGPTGQAFAGRVEFRSLARSASVIDRAL